MHVIFKFIDVECSINLMEKAMSTNNLAVFKSNLVAYYPAIKNSIETIIAKYE